MKHLFSLALSLFILTACSNDDNGPKDYRAQNETEIVAYLEANNLNATRTESGLYYIIDAQGDGTQPAAKSNVTVAYKGYFLNGNVFDESDAEGITFNLQGVISGWTEGIPFFNEGGSGKLLIPAHLGYGSDNYGSIPAGSVLIFDIELLAVN